MEKQKQLEEYLKTLKKVAIAYSGGIDSSYLLFLANKVLPKEQVLAVIANGIMVPRKDYEEAITFLKENHFQYIEVPYKPLEITEFRENYKDRCYHCKKELMTILKKTANENGYEYLLDGKNADDLTVYRPGNRATEEVGIISPLAKFKISKEEIRQYSKNLGISFWNKPSNSCLATRFPYNTNLTEEIRQKIGYVFQDSDSQLFMPTVYEDVAFAPRNYGFSKEEVNERTIEALKSIGIEELQDRQIYRLSGGEKKLASIATVLSMKPDILIFDEPTIALDPKNRRRFINVLNSLKGTKIVTSHDLDLIYDTCDRTILIADGNIIFDGDTKTILQNKDLLEKNGLELPLSLQRR